MARRDLTVQLGSIRTVLDETPCSVVDVERIADSAALVRRAAPGAAVLLALKASYLLPLLRAALAVEVGASVFSGLELSLARRAGFRDDEIVFNGVGRSGELLRESASTGVQVSLESLLEVAAFLEQQPAPDKGCEVWLRLNVAAYRPPGAAGKYEVLGMSVDELALAAERIFEAGHRVTGFSFHAFANQRSAEDHLMLLDRLSADLLRFAALPAVDLRFLNVGGGIASRGDLGDAEAEQLFGAIATKVRTAFGLRPVFELGRFLVADTESVVSRVLDVRRSADGPVAILDVTTNYLIPAPGHRFRIEPLSSPIAGPGPSAEMLFVDRLGSEICRQPCVGVERGSLVSVLNAGAYAGVMKEQFVYPLPRMTFTDRRGVRSTIARPDEKSVAEYHQWGIAETWR